MSGPRHLLGAHDRHGQRQTAKIGYKQMRQEWDNPRLALQSVKDKEIARVNRKMEATNFQVGDLVLVRVFPVNRTQLNEG